MAQTGNGLCWFLHRDIKPANIMVERRTDGQLHPVVMDFGIARDSNDTGITESGTVLGTAAYMSPEQARGEVKRLDRRTDVYSLGATLFDLLAGRPPFVAQSTADILLKVMMEDPPSLRKLIPTVPEPLDTIVNKCLAKEPQLRYETASELADDLGRYLAKESIAGNRVSLVARLRWRARHNRPLAIASVSLIVALITLLAYGIRTRIQTARMEAAAKAQAEELNKRAAVQAQLAQRLGQEITTMEWLLRSARQLPLHDLEREKVIVRKRMEKLQQELHEHGDLAAGLSHYALGRGHLALHEYPQALVELQLAQQAGQDGAELHYALGIVLGKHYEQAMQDARLSGGGEWAKKQLKEIAPKYLTPALVSLERARSLRMDAPQYLEALISFYQNEWERSLQLIEEVRKTAPWIYEATKLAGDIHHEQALLSRDSGKYEIAEKEFAKAVAAYEEAVESGRSDAEVYKGLAETWIRQMEMAVYRGTPLGKLPQQVATVADKLNLTDSSRVVGHMKKATSAMMRVSLSGAMSGSDEDVRVCLNEIQIVLTNTPNDPFAQDVKLICLKARAEIGMARGEDPIPLLRRAVIEFEPILRLRPLFLWGLSDLGVIYQLLGSQQWLRGQVAARESIAAALKYQEHAARLDGTYLIAMQNLLYTHLVYIPMLRTSGEIEGSLASADRIFSSCMKANEKYQQCYLNYGEVYARAAERMMGAGEDSQRYLERALTNLATARKLGDQFLDLAQFTMLAHWVEASRQLKRKQSPLPALTELRKTLPGCLALGKTDAMCLTLAAQASLVEAEWVSQTGKSPIPLLQKAIKEATLATQSPVAYPDSWQVLAETDLRLAKEVKEPQRNHHLVAGHAALAKVFGINPNHAAGRATEGALLLLAAESSKGAKRKELTQSAQSALEKSATFDPLAAVSLAPLRKRAGELLTSTQN